MEEQTINLSDEEKEWKNIAIEGSDYLISTYVGKNCWKVTLSDLVNIWTETITRETASARCQSLNVLLAMEDFDPKEMLDSILKDVPKYAVEKSLNEIKLETCIEGVTFKFYVKLTIGNRQQFWNDITKPMCRSSIELQRRQNILTDLIKKKDEEILQYKLSGARLNGKKTETKPYNEEIFEDGVLSIGKGETRECLNAFQSVIQLYHKLKKFESVLIGNELRSSDPVGKDFKTEIKEEDIDENSEIKTRLTTTTTDSSSNVKNETRRDDETISTVNDMRKKDTEINENHKRHSCVAKIVANVPSSSSIANQPKKKKIEQQTDINTFIR